AAYHRDVRIPMRARFSGGVRIIRPAFLAVLSGVVWSAALVGHAQKPPAQPNAIPHPAVRQTPPASAKAVAARETFRTSFERDVQPMLQDICAGCHDAEHAAAAGGLDMAIYSDPSSLVSRRDGWEKILTRLRAGEMPPLTVEQPTDDEVTAFVNV